MPCPHLESPSRKSALSVPRPGARSFLAPPGWLAGPFLHCPACVLSALPSALLSRRRSFSLSQNAMSTRPGQLHTPAEGLRACTK